MTLAKHYSRKAVIENYRQAGVRLQWLAHAEISRQAMVYCEANREAMIAKALWAISRSPVLRRLAEQERKRRVRNDPKFRTLPSGQSHNTEAKRT
jgi:hypothetical protein